MGVGIIHNEWKKPAIVPEPEDCSLGLPAQLAAVQAVLVASLPVDARVQESTCVCSVPCMPFPFSAMYRNMDPTSTQFSGRATRTDKLQGVQHSLLPVWLDWRAAESLDEGKGFGVLLCPGSEQQLRPWINMWRDTEHVWATAKA